MGDIEMRSSNIYIYTIMIDPLTLPVPPIDQYLSTMLHNVTFDESDLEYKMYFFHNYSFLPF